MTSYVAENIFGKSPEEDETTVITICGSMRYQSVMQEYTSTLIRKGYIVLSPVELGLEETKVSNWSEEEIERLNKEHFWKINQADIVLIVNPDGYFGKATAREVAYAGLTRKTIAFTEELSPEAMKNLKNAFQFQIISMTFRVERDGRLHSKLK